MRSLKCTPPCCAFGGSWGATRSTWMPRARNQRKRPGTWGSGRTGCQAGSPVVRRTRPTATRVGRRARAFAGRRVGRRGRSRLRTVRQADLDIGAVVAQQVGLTDVIETGGIGIRIDHIPQALPRWRTETLGKVCDRRAPVSISARSTVAVIAPRSSCAISDRGMRPIAVGEAGEFYRLDVLGRKTSVVDGQRQHRGPFAQPAKLRGESGVHMSDTRQCERVVTLARHHDDVERPV